MLPVKSTRAKKQTELFISTEDVLAPILAVVFAALLGVVVLQHNPGIATSLAAKVTSTHTTHG
jgi:hypothetical protein